MRYVWVAVAAFLIGLGFIFFRPQNPTYQFSVFRAPVTVPSAHRELPSPEDILRTVNLERERKGLAALSVDPALTAVAQARADDMASQQYYAHTNPQGLYFDDLLKQTNQDRQYACENLDLQFEVSTAIYVRDWLSSQKGHRECMLNPGVTTAGYAVARYPSLTQQGESMTAYVVVAIHATPRQQQVSFLR